MNKKFIAIFSLLIIITCSAAVFAEDIENNDTVMEMDDDSLAMEDIEAEESLQSTVTVNGNTFNDIQNAINSAKDNDTIELEGTYTGNKKVIDVKKSLTIQSTNGATLDAKGLGQIFEINGENVVLKGLTLTKSKDSAVSSSQNDKTCNLTIIDCKFIDNGNGDDGGAIFDANYGSLTVINSTFDSNKAGFGGALYSCCGNFTIIGSNFINNVGKYEGGAIYFMGYASETLNITNCTFTNNRAPKDSGGGGIYCYSSRKINVANSVFNGNSAIYGGAISILHSDLDVDNCTFISNSASDTGGAIDLYGDWDESENMLTTANIVNSNFKNSNAKAKGNSIYAKFYNVNLENCQFESKNYDVYIVAGTLKNTNNTKLNYKINNEVAAEFYAKKFTTTYNSLRTFKVWVHEKTGGELRNLRVKVKITSGSKTKEYYTRVDDEYSYVVIDVSKLGVGKHKVKITLISKYFKATPFKATIKIKKAKTVVKAPKVTAKHKKSKKFKIKVRNKATYKVVKKLKLKIKVYTGKKAKTYNVKTNKKGVASINTKKLKRGYHKVVITSKNKNYVVSKKSSIRIK